MGARVLTAHQLSSILVVCHFRDSDAFCAVMPEIFMIPKVGQLAPDFILESHLEKKVRLSDFRGSCNVVLAFFPLAWTPT